MSFIEIPGSEAVPVPTTGVLPRTPEHAWGRKLFLGSGLHWEGSPMTVTAQPPGEQGPARSKRPTQNISDSFSRSSQQKGTTELSCMLHFQQYCVSGTSSAGAPSCGFWGTSAAVQPLLWAA